MDGKVKMKLMYIDHVVYLMFVKRLVLIINFKIGLQHCMVSIMFTVFQNSSN